ncbi:hypothetical protein [Bacillus kexueae]|uniref:hypothetical protein n=1 Tax=Aeribacillus kexueae TaxID=2078952 RepID=UPI001FB010E7|nr:hypothetical protein [Bacillus kexueae]
MKYKIEVLQDQKIVFVTSEGYFNDLVVAAYKEEFLQKVDTINPIEFILLIDCRYQKVSGFGLEKELQNALNMYLTYGFKQIFFTRLKSRIAQEQLEALHQIEHVTFIHEPEEILNSSS